MTASSSIVIDSSYDDRSPGAPMARWLSDLVALWLLEEDYKARPDVIVVIPWLGQARRR